MARTDTSALSIHMSKDIMRLMRRDRGETLEEIARTEGVSTKTIEKSIKQADLHRSVNTQGNMNSAVVSMLMGNLGRVDKGFKKLFNAKSYVERRLADGSAELVPVDDMTTQLEALKVYGKFVESMQPKGGGVAVSVNSNNQTANVTNIRNGGFVDRLTEIRKRVQEHNLLPPVTVNAREEDPDDEEILDGDVEEGDDE
jgi:hypothetical protein